MTFISSYLRMYNHRTIDLTSMISRTWKWVHAVYCCRPEFSFQRLCGNLSCFSSGCCCVGSSLDHAVRTTLRNKPDPYGEVSSSSKFSLRALMQCF
jgi:hypothetical protein